MTIDSQIRDRLHSAVDATTAPPAFAQTVMKRGRARRRRRYAAVTIVAAIAVTSGAALLSPDAQVARDGEVASGTHDGAAAMTWARSLPEGPVPELPFFGEGGLHVGDQVLPLPASVNESIAPRPVAGGWLVLLGQGESDLAWAVLSADGSVRNLPAVTYENGLGDTRVAVSDDGRRVALGSWVVDLQTMELTDLPHAPERETTDGYYAQVRVVRFTDQGLVYEGAPYEEGLGTTYLLADDGTTTQIDPPGNSHISDGSPADLAIEYDYAADNSDTCVITYALQSGAWVEQGTGCMGRYLGEALAVSGDGRWLLTDDLPEVWDLSEGRFASVDVPEEQVKDWGDNWFGAAVWENDDSFLIPVTDPWEFGGTGAYDQVVQVVRCTMSTGACERAGDEQELVIRTNGMDTGGVRFAQ